MFLVYHPAVLNSGSGRGTFLPLSRGAMKGSCIRFWLDSIVKFSSSSDIPILFGLSVLCTHIYTQIRIHIHICMTIYIDICVLYKYIYVQKCVYTCICKCIYKIDIRLTEKYRNTSCYEINAIYSKMLTLLFVRDLQRLIICQGSK